MTINSAPRARKQPTIREFHGDAFVDNYEWFREQENPEVIAHIEAENAWYAERTAHLAGLREKIVRETASHVKETDVSLPVKQGNYWYWTRTWQGKNYPGLFRAAATGPRPNPDSLSYGETLVYDGNDLAKHEKFFAVGSQAISPDGTLCAIGVDYSGDEEFQIRIHEVESGYVVEDAIANVGYGLEWSADNNRIFYTRVDDAWRPFQVWMHTVGQTPAGDQLIFQEDDERFGVGIEKSRDGKWLVITSESTTTTEVRLASLTGDQPDSVVVCPRQAGLDYSVEVAGEDLLITHNKNNPGFDLARAPLGESSPEEWKPVMVAEPTERILGAQAFKKFAMVFLRSNGATQVRILPRKGAGWGTAVVVDTPELATLSPEENYEWDPTEVVFSMESILTPLTQLAWNAKTGEISTLKVEEVPGFDPAKYVAYRDWAVAEDGTQIPLTVAHLAGLNPQGNPGFLYGYGSYEISIDPMFVPSRLSILDRGIVFAIAHIRGGGEMGRTWYEDGKLLKKRNTFTDFVAAADHLIGSGLVAADRLAAEGRSAGGLLMGAVANLAPDRFRVIHAGVPFVDALTTILKPELPLTVGEWEEWGNPLEDPEVYRYMKSYSPYENVSAVEYPAILATTSINDVRVSYVEPTKWVQQLRDNVLNDPVARPILQYTEMVAGHFGGSGRYAKWEDRARQLAFVFDQLGIDN